MDSTDKAMAITFGSLFFAIALVVWGLTVAWTWDTQSQRTHEMEMAEMGYEQVAETFPGIEDVVITWKPVDNNSKDGINR